MGRGKFFRGGCAACQTNRRGALPVQICECGCGCGFMLTASSYCRGSASSRKRRVGRHPRAPPLLQALVPKESRVRVGGVQLQEQPVVPGGNRPEQISARYDRSSRRAIGSCCFCPFEVFFRVAEAGGRGVPKAAAPLHGHVCDTRGEAAATAGPKLGKGKGGAAADFFCVG
jgi:hypothetical protein